MRRKIVASSSGTRQRPIFHGATERLVRVRDEPVAHNRKMMKTLDRSSTPRSECELVAIDRTCLDRSGVRAKTAHAGGARVDIGAFAAPLDIPDFQRCRHRAELPWLGRGTCEEIAWWRGFRTSDQFRGCTAGLVKSRRGKYLLGALETGR